MPGGDIGYTRLMTEAGLNANLPGLARNPPLVGMDATGRRLFTDRDVAGTARNGVYARTAPGAGIGASTGLTAANGLATRELNPALVRNDARQLAGFWTQPPREELTPIARAARAINQFLQSDDNYPEIDSYCRREFFMYLVQVSIND